ncbi:RecB family exonuclease [Cellulomonas sp. SG140]|uniref:RecB family exonuclease n=1 Tax=Cellulomonas sp. SG140 TaxID=2976536 RepID=UPI0021E7F033|nr:PD-(D/E)XK nuclease family protein [Cellulomonas sp. SG140]
MTAAQGVITLPGRLSYSALSSYAECGERWRLERGYHLDKSTWWATVAGTALHSMTEAWDRQQLGEDVQVPDFETALDIAVAVERSKGREIKASGYKRQSITKDGGPNKKDREWWSHWGPIYFQSYVDWRKLTKWTIPALPDGTVGIEVRIEVPFGGRDQLGFIDRVFILPDGRIAIVDIKSGKEPSGRLQLAVYAIALERLYGIVADLGMYWMAGTGEIVGPFDLTAFSEEYVDHQFEMAWRGIEAGVFLPNITNMCKGCGVRDYCRAFAGSKSLSIPVKDVLRPRTAPLQDPQRVNVTQDTPAAA